MIKSLRNKLKRIPTCACPPTFGHTTPPDSRPRKAKQVFEINVKAIYLDKSFCKDDKDDGIWRYDMSEWIASGIPRENLKKVITSQLSPTVVMEKFIEIAKDKDFKVIDSNVSQISDSEYNICLLVSSPSFGMEFPKICNKLRKSLGLPILGILLFHALFCLAYELAR